MFVCSISTGANSDYEYVLIRKTPSAPFVRAPHPPAHIRKLKDDGTSVQKDSHNNMPAILTLEPESPEQWFEWLLQGEYQQMTVSRLHR